MKRRGGGRIINVTTVGGKAPLARSLPTSVSRAAGINLTKSLANEYAADKILVNTICPGLVKSAQHERRAKGRPRGPLPRDREAQCRSDGSVRRASSPTSWPSSPRSAAYITGTAINFDGGLTAAVGSPSGRGPSGPRPDRPSSREERMLKRSVIVVVALGVGWLPASEPWRSPRTRSRRRRRARDCTRSAAARALEQAHRHLERATHPFGGHRAKALELVKQAEAEVKEAVAFAKANPPGGEQAGDVDAARPDVDGSGDEAMTTMLALHTWTLESSPLPDALRATRAAGWDGVELRRIDFARAAEKGQAADDVLRMVKASGLRVACVGVELGWMFAEGDELRRLLQAFTESCRWAAELGCATVMSASDRGRGDPARAATNMRAAGDIAAAHRVRLAVEFNSQAEQLNNPEGMRAIVSRAAHPSCGLLLDTYHLQRSGATLAAIDDVTLGEIAYVQYSDVPRARAQAARRSTAARREACCFKEILGSWTARDMSGS